MANPTNQPNHARGATLLAAAGAGPAPVAAAAAPPQGRAFRRAQWRILLLVMFCYLFLYTGRQNFAFAAKGMQEELGLSATQLGLFNAVLLAAYGLGQVVNGNLSDMLSARHMVAVAAVLSFALNWGVGLSHSLLLAVVCWGANGYVQSAAWPALSRTLHHWWPQHERGKAMGFVLLAAGFSSSLTFLLCILVVGSLDWRWVFRLPVGLLLLGGAVFFGWARNSPEDDGFPALPPERTEGADAARGESSLARYGQVLRNGRFLLACGSIGCESIARWGLLQWVPLYVLGPTWRQDPTGLWLTMALPLGMAAGALSAGLVADRWFPERRGRLVLWMLTAGALACLLLPQALAMSKLAGMLVLGLAGFLVFGPQSTYWVLCPLLVGRERAGTATGLMDAAAYGSAALGQLLIGWTIDVTQSAASAFVVIAAVCLLGAVAIIPVRR